MHTSPIVEAVIFDHDGTLAPTLERQEQWFKHYSEMQGKSWGFTFEEFREFYNQLCALEGGVQNVYDRLGLPSSIRDKTHPVWPAFEAFNREHPLELYPGMRETVEELWRIGALTENVLRNRRMRLGVNTTNSWKSIRGDLEKGGVLPYFDSFVTKEVLDTYHGSGNGAALYKPSKVSIALMLGLLGSNGNTTVHIGDTVNDLLASHEVMRFDPGRKETLITVGAGYGYEGREKLEDGAEVDGERIHFTHLINEPRELVGIVKGYLGK